MPSAYARKTLENALGIVAQLFLPLSKTFLPVTHASVYECVFEEIPFSGELFWDICNRLLGLIFKFE